MVYPTTEQLYADVALLRSAYRLNENYKFVVSPDGLKARTSSQGLYEYKHIVTAFSTCELLRNCCGILYIDYWQSRDINDLSPQQVAATRLFIHLLHRSTDDFSGSIRTGCIITGTNDNYVGVNKFLAEQGFVPQKFHNANSGNSMSMWTLVLHP